MATPAPIGQDDGSFQPATPQAIGKDDGSFQPEALGPRRTIGTPAQEKFRELSKGAREAWLKFQGKDPSIDYSEGLPFMDRVALGRMDNDEERRLYLTKRFGADALGTDPGGRYWVKMGDKRVSTAGGGLLGDLGALALSQSPEAAGGTMGAVVGSGGGPLGTLVGAGAGTAAGKWLDDLLKRFEGTYAKTLPEEAKTLAIEGTLGAGGEALGRAGSAVFGRITKGPLPKFISGATPETDAMTAIALRGGAVPPSGSALPHLKVAKWHQLLSDKVVGPFSDMERRNTAFIETEIRNILEQGGVPKSQIDAVFAEMANPRAKMSTTDLGLDIKRYVKAYADTLTQTSEREMQIADRALDDQLKHLDLLTRRFNPGDLGVDVAAGIQQARKDFGTAASKLYKRVDSLVGDDPIIGSGPVKTEVDRILKELPKKADGTPVLGDPRILKALNDLKGLPNNISFSDAQSLRATLGELGQIHDLTPGVSLKRLGDLRMSVDVAIAKASGDPRVGAARSLLRAANDFYRDGIRKFEDTTINRLAKMAETGLPPDPSEVAALIAKPGNQARTSQILKLLPPDVQRRVAAADFGNMIDDVTTDLGGKPMVSAKGLAAEIERRGPLLDMMYGKQTAAQIRSYAKNLAAKDMLIPPGFLQAGSFRDTLEKAIRANTELDTFMKTNYLSALANPKGSPDAVLRWMVKPGQEGRLEQAFKFFGPNSPQVASIRRAALEDLLHRSITTGEEGVGKAIAGSGIEDALKSFTKKQQEMLFPNGLADDIELLAKQAKFLFPKAGDESMAGFAAGAILATPIPFRWVLQLHAATWGAILSRPGVIRFLALGLRGDGPMRAATRNTFQALMRGLPPATLTPESGGEEQQPQ